MFAVVSGEAQINLANYSTVAQLVEGGKLKIIGVTGARRDPLLPNVLTFAENGLENYEVEIWYGFFAPAKTPEATIQADIVASTPEQLAAKVKRDLARYRKIILESGMQID